MTSSLASEENGVAPREGGLAVGGPWKNLDVGLVCFCSEVVDPLAFDGLLRWSLVGKHRR